MEQILHHETNGNHLKKFDLMNQAKEALNDAIEKTNNLIYKIDNLIHKYII